MVTCVCAKLFSHVSSYFLLVNISWVYFAIFGFSLLYCVIQLHKIIVIIQAYIDYNFDNSEKDTIYCFQVSNVLLLHVNKI